MVLAAGPLSPSEAKSLLASVNYEANVTWNENTFLNKKDNIGNLVWNALILCAILMVLRAGGWSGIWRPSSAHSTHRPGTDFPPREEVEFISLHLSEKESSPPRWERKFLNQSRLRWSRRRILSHNEANLTAVNLFPK